MLGKLRLPLGLAEKERHGVVDMDSTVVRHAGLGRLKPSWNSLRARQRLRPRGWSGGSAQIWSSSWALPVGCPDLDSSPILRSQSTRRPAALKSELADPKPAQAQSHDLRSSYLMASHRLEHLRADSGPPSLGEGRARARPV